MTAGCALAASSVSASSRRQFSVRCSGVLRASTAMTGSDRREHDRPARFRCGECGRSTRVQQGERGAHCSKRPATARCDQFRQRHVRHHDDERHAALSGKCRKLQQRQVLVLRVRQGGPRQGQESSVATQCLHDHPRRRRGQRPRQPAASQDRQHRTPQRRVQRHVRGKHGHLGDADRRNLPQPAEDSQGRNDAEREADHDRSRGPSVAAREQQRNERDERERPEVCRRKGEHQQRRTRRDRSQDPDDPKNCRDPPRRVLREEIALARAAEQDGERYVHRANLRIR